MDAKNVHSNWTKEEEEARASARVPVDGKGGRGKKGRRRRRRALPASKEKLRKTQITINGERRSAKKAEEEGERRRKKHMWGKERDK